MGDATSNPDLLNGEGEEKATRMSAGGEAMGCKQSKADLDDNLFDPDST